MTKQEFIEKYKRNFSYTNREEQIAEMEANLDAYAQNKSEGHKFEINGYWLMLDPNADEATVEHVQILLMKSKRENRVPQNCSNCKHEEVHSIYEPCVSCSVLTFNSLKSNWEAKQ